jgi:hypothetical protein
LTARGFQKRKVIKNYNLIESEVSLKISS